MGPVQGGSSSSSARMRSFGGRALRNDLPGGATHTIAYPPGGGGYSSNFKKPVSHCSKTSRRLPTPGRRGFVTWPLGCQKWPENKRSLPNPFGAGWPLSAPGVKNQSIIPKKPASHPPGVKHTLHNGMAIPPGSMGFFFGKFAPPPNWQGGRELSTTQKWGALQCCVKMEEGGRDPPFGPPHT